MKFGFLKSQEEKIKEWSDDKLNEEIQKAKEELEKIAKYEDSNKSPSATSALAFGVASGGYNRGLKMRLNLKKKQMEKKLKLCEEELKRREQKSI